MLFVGKSAGFPRSRQLRSAVFGGGIDVHPGLTGSGQLSVPGAESAGNKGGLKNRAGANKGLGAA